jgi:hypothetical protein
MEDLDPIALDLDAALKGEWSPVRKAAVRQMVRILLGVA